MAMAMLVLASSASPQQRRHSRPLCPSLSGKSISVSGKITDTEVQDDGAYYTLDSKDSPCASLYFSVVDPSGHIRCKKGQRIKATGIVQENSLGANLSATDYTCK
jgi:hypothetical protein